MMHLRAGLLALAGIFAAGAFAHADTPALTVSFGGEPHT